MRGGDTMFIYILVSLCSLIFGYLLVNKKTDVAGMESISSSLFVFGGLFLFMGFTGPNYIYYPGLILMFISFGIMIRRIIILVREGR